MAVKAQKIDIRPMNINTIDFTIVGTTPLIVHAWSTKAKQEMLDKQRGKKVDAKHKVKIPYNDYKNSLHWLTEMPDDGKTDEEAEESTETAIANGAKFGFKCDGIKASIISGAKRGGLSVVMAELKGSMFIEGATEGSTVDLAEIIGAPHIREDMVRIGGQSKTADIRYRAEFTEWKIPLRLRYIEDGKYSLEQIMNMVDYGGFCTGIGEWRPEKGGQFGMYRLER